MIYVVGLVVFLATAAIFLEFTYWIEKEVRSTQLWPETQDFGGGRAARAQVGLTERDEVAPSKGSVGSASGSVSPTPHDAYLNLVAPRPYDWKQK